MKEGWAGLAFLAALFVAVLSESEVTDKTVVSARLECCYDKWKLYPMVRTFAGQDLHLFHNVKYKDVLEAEPELLLLNVGGDIVERIDLAKFSRDAINKLLLKKGFYKKAYRGELVPKEYRKGTYIKREEL